MSKRSKFVVTKSIEADVEITPQVYQRENKISMVINSAKNQVLKLRNSVSDLKDQNLNVVKQVRDFRKKLDEHLNNLQEQLLNEIRYEYNLCTNEMLEQETEVQSQTDRIQRLAKDQSKLKSENTAELVTATDTLEKTISSQNEKVLFMQKNNVRVEYNPALKSILENAQDFGRFLVTKEPVWNNNHARKPSYKAKADFDAIRLEFEKKIEIPIPNKGYSYIMDCVLLKSKDMVFADRINKRLVIHKSSGAFSHEIRLPKPPHYITAVDNEKLAISYGKPFSNIDIINTVTRETESTITGCVTDWSMGVSYSNGKLYIVDDGSAIQEVTLDGKVTSSIPLNGNVTSNRKEDVGKKGNTPCVHHLTAHQNKIYYASTLNDTVYCYDNTGKELWSFSDSEIIGECTSPPLAVDGNGNVILVNYESDYKIMIISADGKKIKYLPLGKDDFMPNGISFDETKQMLLICDHRSHAKLFNVRRSTFEEKES